MKEKNHFIKIESLDSLHDVIELVRPRLRNYGSWTKSAARSAFNFYETYGTRPMCVRICQCDDGILLFHADEDHYEKGYGHPDFITLDELKSIVGKEISSRKATVEETIAKYALSFSETYVDLDPAEWREFIDGMGKYFDECRISHDVPIKIKTGRSTVTISQD